MTDEFKSFIKFPQGAEADRCFYTLRLDTYGKGCGFHCNYCYGRGLLDFRKMWNYESPAVADIEKIRKLFVDTFEKDKKTKNCMLLKERKPLRLGGMTDCLQDCERNEKVTYELLKILDKYDYPYLLLTKSDLVGDYVDVINPDLAYIQVTVTTLNDELSKMMEPNAPMPEKRLNAIQTLSDNGVYVAGRISPLFPRHCDGFHTTLTECDKEFDYYSTDLVEEICNHGAKTIVGEMMRFNNWSLKWMKEAGLDLKWMINENSVKSGNSWHFSSEEKMVYFKEVKEICDKNNVDFTVCEDNDVEYFKELWANPNDCCNGLGKIKGFSKTWKD